MSSVAVVTVARGRHDHLRSQNRSLAAGVRRPDLRVVVAMDDPCVEGVVEETWTSDVPALVVPLTGSHGEELPLARARNLGAALALERGADLLVLLDVDCLATPTLLERYVAAAERLDDEQAPRLLCGPVAYLPPRDDPAMDYPPNVLAETLPHPSRPSPLPDELVIAQDFTLFWSLSFAMTAQDWRTVGGFDEHYVGYGAEDTDFGQQTAMQAGRLWWVGGALAQHQWHPVSDPPVEHLEAVVRNANRFHARWGWFPMKGWLEEFYRLGLAEPCESGENWRLIDDRRA